MNRIDIIGQNGNDGDHYDAFSVCVQCGDEIEEYDLQISTTQCHKCRAKVAAAALSQSRQKMADRNGG